MSSLSSMDVSAADRHRPEADSPPPPGAGTVDGLLDALFANSDTATVITDDAGQINYVTAATAHLLGYDRRAVIGRSVFEFLHSDDLDEAAGLFEMRLDFDGADQGTEMRLRCADDTYISVVATAALLPPNDVTADFGACAITLRLTSDTDPRVLSMHRQLVVGGYANELAADLVAAPGPDEALDRVRRALGEIGLLSGAESVSMFLERQGGIDVDTVATWRVPGGGRIGLTRGHPGRTRLFTEHLVVDQLSDHELDGVIDDPSIDSMLSTPFTSGSLRGALVLARRRTGPAWWASDSELVCAVARLMGRSIRATWSEHLLALTYRHGPVAFSIHTWDGKLFDCNDQYLELFALDRPQALDLASMDSIPEQSRALLHVELERLRAGELDRVDLELELERADGSMIWVRSTGVNLSYPGSPEGVVLLSYADITDRRAQRAALEFAADHDHLTGAANRSALWRRVDQMQTETGRLPILLTIDLDRFKQVNDTHGHHIGDLVLQAVLRRLRQTVRSSDLVARVGGDEFAIVLPHATLAQAEQVADRLRTAAQSPIQVEGRRIKQTFSVGVSSGARCADLAEMMICADRALYAAKHAGRDRHVVFDNETTDPALEGLALERDLHDALELGQLAVHYQPEFRLHDRAIIGVEALIRWHHPVHGLVPAADFIGIAERTGLIDHIGQFALRRATRDFARACHDVGRDDLVLRVNVSAREFAKPTLVENVRSAIVTSGLAPDRLCLEMTETTLMDAPDVALATLGDLHQIGVQFAIDDFGTGYSSLAYLKRFPVDVLKIDRAFVHDIDRDTESRAIVRSIIELARALSLDVVAEGVSDEAQLEVLAMLGCERAQGWLVAPALPIADVMALVASGPDHMAATGPTSAHL